MCLKKKVRLKEKRRYTKKTFFVVGLKTDKTKSDSKEELNSKISNVDSIVKPASELLNMSSKAELGSGNGDGEELGNELIVMIYGALTGLFCVFSYLSISLEMVNVVTLKLPNVHSSIDFKTILWQQKKELFSKLILIKTIGIIFRYC